MTVNYPLIYKEFLRPSEQATKVERRIRELANYGYNASVIR